MEKNKGKVLRLSGKEYTTSSGCQESGESISPKLTTSQDNDSDSNNENNGIRARKRKSNPEELKKNKWKVLRLSGKK